MASPFKAGSKAEVIRLMASFAIRDQEALIDAYTPRFGEPGEEAARVIAEAKGHIRDFKLLMSRTKREV